MCLWLLYSNAALTYFQLCAWSRYWSKCIGGVTTCFPPCLHTVFSSPLCPPRFGSQPCLTLPLFFPLPAALLSFSLLLTSQQRRCRLPNVITKNLKSKAMICCLPMCKAFNYNRRSAHFPFYNFSQNTKKVAGSHFHFHSRFSPVAHPHLFLAWTFKSICWTRLTHV